MTSLLMRLCPHARANADSSSADATAASEPATALGRGLVLAYGVGAYLAFFTTITYTIGFVGNWIVPKSIDTGGAHALAPAITINAALLMLFAVQHTIMARPAFKRWWTRFVPESIERSTFVLAACACLGLLFWQWQSLPEVVWDVELPVLRYGLMGLLLAGFGIVFASSFMVNHFDLFGLRQVWLRYRGREYEPIGFRVVGLYRLVRHPLMLGFLIAFWATPTMTQGHLLVSVLVTAYIFVGLWFEERTLIGELGEHYRQYKRHVPSVIPFLRRG